MKVNNEIAGLTAEFLLQAKAIKLSKNTPFNWASGWKSPIYCDNRKILSYPKIRTFIRQKLVEAIKESYGSVELIAGVATGGIAMGALVAQEMDLPFVYVRSSSKGHGLQNRIEGALEKEQKVVVVEDLVSTGKSSLTAVEALREQKCLVLGMVSIFNYGFDLAKQNFEEKKCEIVSLCDYDHLINVAFETGYILKSDIKPLKNWRKNPSTWNP